MKIVCVIDDDPIFVLTVVKLIQIENFCDKVVVYKNGAEAITGINACLKSGGELPCIILLDINMPVMNGWEFLEKFIEIPDHTIVDLFISTSSINRSDVTKSKKYKIIKDYLVKPITSKILRELSKK